MSARVEDEESPLLNEHNQGRVYGAGSDTLDETNGRTDAAEEDDKPKVSPIHIVRSVIAYILCSRLRTVISN